MPYVKADQKRRFWQVAVRHMAHLRAEGFSSDAGFFAVSYAEMIGKADSLREEFREDWDEVTHEGFREVEERRRSYHEDERSLQLRRLRQKALALPEGDPAVKLALSDLEDPIPRQMLQKAVHDTSNWQYREPGEVEDGSAVVLGVYSLSSSETNELGRRALEAARHQIALDVLDEVSHYVDGHDVYDADQRTALSSPAEMADAVQAKHADKPRAERVDIAMQEYKLDESYNGNTDEQHVRKAINEALRRREQ
jgi:hypothetical protein